MSQIDTEYANSLIETINALMYDINKNMTANNDILIALSRIDKIGPFAEN
jgi:hypothetical protein